MTIIKNFVIGIAIFILTIAVGIYGISAIYGSGPDYETYCPNLFTQSLCENAGGEWIDNTQLAVDDRGNSKPVSIGGGYCQYDFTQCSENYENAERVYARNLFFIALPLGIAIIALGALVFGLESVGAGLMAGGIGIVLYGVGGFWRFADEWLKFVLSLAGLIFIIWLAYYFNNKRDSGKRKK
jgi:hypothetical protein